MRPECGRATRNALDCCSESSSLFGNTLLFFSPWSRAVWVVCPQRVKLQGTLSLWGPDHRGLPPHTHTAAAQGGKEPPESSGLGWGSVTGADGNDTVLASRGLRVKDETVPRLSAGVSPPGTQTEDAGFGEEGTSPQPPVATGPTGLLSRGTQKGLEPRAEVRGLLFLLVSAHSPAPMEPSGA